MKTNRHGLPFIGTEQTRPRRMSEHAKQRALDKQSDTIIQAQQRRMVQRKSTNPPRRQS